MSKRTVSFIDESFENWMSNSPESGHPLDMKRFYVFVKTVLRFERKERDSEWLRKAILKHPNGMKFSSDEIEDLCSLYRKLRAFDKAIPTGNPYDNINNCPSPHHV